MIKVGDICSCVQGTVVVVAVTSESRNNVTFMPIWNKRKKHPKSRVARKISSKELTVIEPKELTDLTKKLGSALLDYYNQK